jgi:hypothetical protein
LKTGLAAVRRSNPTGIKPSPKRAMRVADRTGQQLGIFGVSFGE